MTVNIHEAKTNLSKLIAMLEEGEEIIIAKAGKPIAKLEKYAPSPRREPNKLRGKVKYLEDFDAADAEITALFEEDA